MDSTYQAILARFQKLRPLANGRGWKCLCPAHGDREPSLMLWVDQKQALRAKCHAGCGFDQIRAAIGSDLADWFPPKFLQIRERRMEGRKIVATYDYTDLEGKLLYQSVRFDPKGFAARRPDPSDCKKWVWDLQGVQRVPYNLVLIRNLPEQPVIVVEGEKDADNLKRLGFVATTNQGGAGQWDHGHGKHLQGRRVAVIPDNDPPGLRHALAVAGNLIYWGAESVRLVMIPGLKDKGDVSDWLAECSRGRGLKMDQIKKELIGLIKQCPEWKPVSLAA